MVAFVVRTSATIYFFVCCGIVLVGVKGGDVMVWCDVMCCVECEGLY